MQEHDLVIVGGGPGGYVAAIKAAQLGLDVAVVERDSLGGTCLNRGCIPTKTLMHTTDLLEEVGIADICGLMVDGAHVDIDKLFERKDAVVSQIVGGVGTLFKANGVTLYKGDGKITGEHTVVVSGDEPAEITAKDIIIATGSTPAVPPIPGLDLPGVVTSDGLLDKAVDYKSLLIIGGGVIGVEFASVYAALGCKVTVVEMLDRLVANMDKEISQNLTMIMKKRGIDIYTSAAVKSLEEADGGLAVNFTYKDKEEQVVAQGVLAAMGRKPVTAGLFEGVDVELNRGFVVVDDEYRTNIPSIRAIGDVIGGAMLAHKASAEGIKAVELIAGVTPDADTTYVPGCVYTTPEIATVGMSEAEAVEAGHEVVVGKFPMSGNGKTIIAQSPRGFIKVIFDAKTDKLLGAALMCERATDMIGGFVTALCNGLTRDQMKTTMWPHPTFSEGIGEAIHVAGGSAVHVAPSKRR